MNDPAIPTRAADADRPLAGCTLVVTRPRPGADALSRRLQRRGATVLRLPGQTIVANADFDWRSALCQRSGVDGWIFSSPSAVMHATPLLDAGLHGALIAVGTGTAGALRRRGLSPTLPPERQDSEGLLALPALKAVGERRFVIVGAPGGRGLIADELRRRGAEVSLWHVYRREAPRWSARQLAALATTPGRLLTLLSSTDTLDRLVRNLPAASWDRLRGAPWVASSPRLAAALRQAGADQIAIAASAGARDMTNAAVLLVKR